jgi:TolB protein
MRFLIFFVTIFLSSQAIAIQTINVTHGNFDPIPIAINKFSSDSSADSALAEKILEVVTSDLKNSGLFRPISPAAFIENKTGVDHRPLFAAWRQINATVLVNGKIKKLDSGTIELSFILWDIVAEKDIAGEVFEVPQKLWRRAAHKMADKIYERVTGDKGYFDTKIAYVSETGPAMKQIKRIAVMDQDGANHTFLTDGKNLVLTPRFSPKADKLLYLAYTKGQKPRVHIRNLRTGKDSLLTNFPSMNFAPRFSPDGDKALISIAKNGVTNIAEVNLHTGKIRMLTNGGAINTSPSYSPDGHKIVFNSDRNGTRQLYVMNSDGSGVERISFGTGSYAEPAWSPRGDYIAFTKQNGDFSIGVMRPDGNGERLITNGYLVEGPTWAPNGRVIIFAKGQPRYKKQSAMSAIYSIDITGYNERLLKTPKDASDPDWSRTLD